MCTELLNSDMIGRDHTGVWWTDYTGQTSETVANEFARTFWQEPTKVIDWCGNLFALEDKLSPYRIDFKTTKREGWDYHMWQVSRVHCGLDDQNDEYHNCDDCGKLCTFQSGDAILDEYTICDSCDDKLCDDCVRWYGDGAVPYCQYCLDKIEK